MEITRSISSSSSLVKLSTILPHDLFIYDHKLYIRHYHHVAMRVGDRTYGYEDFDGKDVDVFPVTIVHANCV